MELFMIQSIFSGKKSSSTHKNPQKCLITEEKWDANLHLCICQMLTVHAIIVNHTHALGIAIAFTIFATKMFYVDIY